MWTPWGPKPYATDTVARIVKVVCVFIDNSSAAKQLLLPEIQKRQEGGEISESRTHNQTFLWNICGSIRLPGGICCVYPVFNGL